MRVWYFFHKGDDCKTLFVRGRLLHPFYKGQRFNKPWNQLVKFSLSWNHPSYRWWIIYASGNYHLSVTYRVISA